MSKISLKKTLTLACIAMTLTASGQVSREKQIEGLKTMPVLKAAFKNQRAVQLQSIRMSQSNRISTRADEVKYNTPKGLCALLQGVEGWVNYLSFNSLENNYTETSFNYLIAPRDSLLSYYGASSVTGSSSWAIPGGDPATSTSTNVQVSYPEVGEYAFPTLTISGQSYTSPGKLVVGGKGEIVLADCKEIGKTCAPFYLTYKKGGSPSGSGSGFESIGNLFIISQDAMVSAVNVYVAANPKASNPDNKVKMTIYEPDLSGSSPELEGTEIASVELKVSEMMANSDEITGLQGQDKKAFAGMASFKLPAPVKVGGVFYVSISNFGDDVAGGDYFSIVVDKYTPQFAENPEYMFNYCSFVKTEVVGGGIGYVPFYAVFGEQGPEIFPNENASLFICPVIDYSLAEQSVENVSREIKNQVYVADQMLSLQSDAFGEAGIYTISGQLVRSVSLNNGSNTVSTAELTKGVYIVRFADGENIKIVI